MNSRNLYDSNSPDPSTRAKSLLLHYLDMAHAGPLNVDNVVEIAGIVDDIILAASDAIAEELSQVGKRISAVEAALDRIKHGVAD